jgi:hypothetical protein
MSMEMFAHSPKGPPDVEAHRVEPEEGRQKEEVHRDGCKKNDNRLDAFKDGGAEITTTNY